ncbi:ABC transporter substrate-binding protein [Nonomuraea rhizosphaerae]|uniref:ABC transporter substrate-binding protein n=1 Tax=Nonomuraea rhizosphaerae TaxID=2665663 RepID=UPI001C5EC7B6|nr:ABC transporter substrate-binding protein [Nonomuraea rhizosphaerae]
MTIARRDLFRMGGLAAAGLAAPGLLAACASTSSPASGEKAAAALRVSLASDATTLDPQKQGDLSSMNVLINVFDTITVRDTDDKLVGGLAERWESVDPRTWRFHLRQGVTFHNGEPCDAAAVAYSIERLIDPATRSPIVELRLVTKAKVVDDRTVDLITKEPDPILPAKLSLFGGVVVPPKYIKEKGEQAFAEHPVGTGPFTFESWQRDSQITLKANPGYWNGKPAVEQLTFRVMPDPSSSLAALQSGEVDVVTGLTPDAADQLGDAPGFKVVTAPGVRTFFVSLDTTEGPLKDKRVRQALNHALDVPTLIKSVLNGAAERTPTLIPRQAFGFDPAIQPFAHDLAKAKSLLAEAGQSGGFSLKMSASTADKDIAQAISGQLAAVGVKAEVSLLDPATFKGRLVSDNKKALGAMYYVGNSGWTMDASSNLQSFVRHDRRQSRWDNSRADELIDKEEQSVDPETRRKAFTELQNLLIDEAPFLYLYQVSILYAVSDKVRWKTNANGTLAMASAKLA